MDHDSQTYVLGIIPARWASTRFPGKPLHLIAGKPLIQHVWERCQDCSKLDSILVATDDQRIADTCQAFGAQVTLTSSDHPTGTDRIAEAAEVIPETTHIINIQGDEPLIEPALIDELATALTKDPALEMASAANPIHDTDLIQDPNVVKCVLKHNGDALYFSRSPLPYQRDAHIQTTYYRHKGIYAYRKDFLQQFVQWEPSPLEIAESLEQLRALENNARIRIIITDDDSGGIDTLEQANALEVHLTQTQSSHSI